MSHALPNLGLTGGFAPGDSGWGPPMDLNLMEISILLQGRFKGIITVLPGAPAQGDIYILDASAGANPTQIAYYDSGAWAYIVPSSGWMMYNTATNQLYQFGGVNWAVFTGSAGGIVQWSWWFSTTPSASELLGMYVADKACTFRANLGGSQVTIPATNPAATFLLTIAKCPAGSTVWTTVGTISISTAGVATLATTGGATIALAAGDALRVTGPATADTTITNFTATLLADF